MLPNREQTENGKFSIFRCVLHRSSQNSLFGQVAGPFQEIISQPHREQHFTETHHKITENSLFFSILYFPFSISRPELLPPQKMQFRDCYFCRNSLIMIINRKDYFFATNAIDTLWTLSKFSPYFSVFFEVNTQLFEILKAKRQQDRSCRQLPSPASLYAKHLLLILP